MDKYLIEDYNPLRKNNSWVYLKNNKSTLSHFVSEDTELNGLPVQKVISSDGTTVFLESKNGLNTYIIKKKVGTLSYDPPISMSPKEIAIGEVHSYVSRMTFSIFNMNINFGSISGSNCLVGIEDIKVPAGYFEKCLKFESVASKKGFLGVDYKLTIWFAKNVGEVKCEFTTKMAGITSRVKKELIEAVIGQTHFPSKLN
jgi:hypothetical protein